MEKHFDFNAHTNVATTKDKEEPLKTFYLPVCWEMSAAIRIEGQKSLEDAVKYFQDNASDFPLPLDTAEYTENSFQLSDDNMDVLRDFQNHV